MNVIAKQDLLFLEQCIQKIEYKSSMDFVYVELSIPDNYVFDINKIKMFFDFGNSTSIEQTRESQFEKFTTVLKGKVINNELKQFFIDKIKV